MTLLQMGLSAVKEGYSAMFAREEREILDRSRRKDAELKGCFSGIGGTIPPFSLPDRIGRIVSSDSILRDKKRLFVVFFRGGWCPYSRLQLQAYNRIAAAVSLNKGEIVAISPMAQEGTWKLHRELELTYPVFSDPGCSYAREIGVSFKLDAPAQEVYTSKGLLIPLFNGDDSWELPVPSIFLIDQGHNILYRWLETDYGRRPDPADLLAEFLRSR